MTLLDGIDEPLGGIEFLLHKLNGLLHLGRLVRFVAGIILKHFRIFTVDAHVHRPSAGGRTSDQRDFTVTYSGIRFHIVLYENEENAIEKRKMDRFPAVTQGCLYGSTAGDADGKLRSLD